jgi:hypothetical protein
VNLPEQRNGSDHHCQSLVSNDAAQVGVLHRERKPCFTAVVLGSSRYSAKDSSQLVAIKQYHCLAKSS